MSGITWQRPPSALAADIEAYGRRVEAAVAAVGEFIAPKLEADAKAHARWTDRSSQARQGLTGVSEVAEHIVTIYLYHKAAHGVFLEMEGEEPDPEWGIIPETLLAHYGETMALLARIFREAA